MARLARVRFRLWQRLLTPGWGRPTAAARLRGWARVLDWEAAAMTVGRRAITTRALWTPLRVWREAGNEVAKFGAEVEAVSGVPPREQRRQLWWLGVRYGLNALSYLDYQLYRPERRRRAEAWVQEREYYRVVRWYNRLHEDSDVGTMLDKRGFSEWCRRHGLPAVPTLVEYDHGALIAAATPGDPEASLPAADLFSKPSDATGGHGTERWRYGGDRTWTASSDGRVRGGRELLAELAETSLTLPRKYGRTSRRIMLQPCLRNHADLLPLTPGALCTVRVLTYREPGGRARAILGAYKMATGASPADNFHFGGIVAPVDIATGRLGPALRRQGRVLVPVERHPDTGTPIAGAQLPFWRETLALAERALDLTHRLMTLGWDIAITDDGPVLIEANPASNPDIAQAPSGVPLDETPLPAAIDRYVRTHFGL